MSARSKPNPILITQKRLKSKARRKTRAAAAEIQAVFERALGELLILLSRRASHAVILEKVEAIYRKILDSRRKPRARPDPAATT